MNLLPGLRELRAPLAAGYLWLGSLWLILSRAGWLPSKRPPGQGEVAQLWDLGGTLGKTVVLAAITFIAYLIGSFLEMDPDGRLADELASIVNYRRLPSYLFSLNPSEMQRLGEERIQREWGRDNMTRYVSRSLSATARWDLLLMLRRRNMIRGPLRGENLGDTATWQPDAGVLDAIGQYQGDKIINGIVEELPQLASRLLVKDKELYGKYDRLMTEASVRINVAIPLVALLCLATWLSGIPIWLRTVFTLLAVAFGFILLRQGILRTVSARDVIAQALVIDELQSRNMPARKPAEGRDEERLESQRSIVPPSSEQTQDNGEDTGPVVSVDGQ